MANLLQSLINELQQVHDKFENGEISKENLSKELKNKANELNRIAKVR